MSHPQALNKEQMLELMGEAIPAIARRLKQDEGWAFLMKQANRVKELETENASLKADNDNLRKALEVVEEDRMRLKAEVERLQNPIGFKIVESSSIPDGQAFVVDIYQHAKDKAEIESLKAEVERLTADLNKMTKTPEGVDYVEVDVGFWTKSGSRLPSSYRTFWSNAKGVQS